MKHFFQYLGLFVFIFSFPTFVVADNAFRLPEQCLYGLWKSDREKTVEYNLPIWQQKWGDAIPKDDPLPIKHRLQMISDVFGHMEWQFTPDGVFTTNMPIYKNAKTKGRYSIVKVEKNFFHIHGIDDLNKEGSNMNIFFETPNIIWVKIRLGREYFRRITPIPKQCVMPKK
ncbi:MAG: hypothetical protein IJR46_01375 [Neisseriaceae bacterium]|nr:hypothetical protein [Neisseriaceae bacterium]